MLRSSYLTTVPFRTGIVRGRNGGDHLTSASVEILRPESRAEGPSLEEFLLSEGKLTQDALRRAQQACEAGGERIELVLSSLGLVSELDVAVALSKLHDVQLVVASDFPAEPVLADQINRKFLKYSKVLPLEEKDDSLVVAMALPDDDYPAEALEFLSGKPVVRCVATMRDIEAAVERLYGGGESGVGQFTDEIAATQVDSANDDVERLRDLASEAPVIRLVNVLIGEAVDQRASDIHIEPMENRLRVRMRVDGILTDMNSPPRDLGSAIVSRLKIMAHLDIAERRLAQDGRIRLAVRGREIDFRVSTNPTMYGESVVLRILDRSSIALDFNALGFGGEQLETYLDLLRLPHGIILITGPTGSGKTTTLYASLTLLNSPEKKVLTIEDPVEYLLEGVNQVQVRPKIGLTFASALRTFLRQDPDIMMVGEIRDLETAQIAVQAALTGHTILSTLHTNDAASAVTRLLDMGVEDFLLTSTINGVVGQRLVRTLCRHCREPYQAPQDLIEKTQLRRVVPNGSIPLYRAKGCTHCNHTGYSGRTCIHEILVMSERVKSLVLKRVDANEIQSAAIAEGMAPMTLDGLRKAVAGVTTVEEIFRVTKDL